MFHSCHLGGCVYPGFSYQKCSNPVGGCYWVRGISNFTGSGSSEMIGMFPQDGSMVKIESSDLDIVH